MAHDRISGPNLFAVFTHASVAMYFQYKLLKKKLEIQV